MSENINIKIYRYDPEKDAEGGLEQYSLSKLPGMRILGALKALNDHGHNISYRYNCEEWECGSCAVYINGKKSVLACKTEVQDGMVIEPVPDLKVLKDLIVDREKENKKQAELYKVPGTKIGSELSYEVQNKMWKAITCMECGVCLSSCPVLHPTGGSYTYSGPEFMVQLFRTELDTRVDKNSLETSKKEGIWECTACRHCVENCPQDIPILDQILYLRNKIIDEKGKLVPPRSGT
ncbi:MAG: 2Fe-2S iron-sulfur cluster-binding protein [Desulfobacterales bacterium]|nr:2Fe-2S iron-sulfur cluster-binding protein [Desulfobacterales bacterium]